MTDRRQTTQHITNHRQQLVKTSRTIQPHIHGISTNVLGFQCLNQYRHQIRYIDEITCLFAIPENADRQAFASPFGKNADHPGVRR